MYDVFMIIYLMYGALKADVFSAKSKRNIRKPPNAMLCHADAVLAIKQGDSEVIINLASQRKGETTLKRRKNTMIKR